jgi:hypothetical protein
VTAFLDKGSFRDRRARVYRVGGEIIRLLDETAYKNWHCFFNSRLYKKLDANGSIVETEAISIKKIRKDLSIDGWVAALKHEPISFISYP